MDSGFPVSRQNFLTVSVYPLVSARRLQLNAIFLDERGSLVPSTITIPTTTAGTKTETELQCIDGYLLSCTVTDDLLSTLPGEIYCSIAIKVGQVDSSNPVAILSRGHVYEGHGIYYPGGNDIVESRNRGRYRSISGASPGAGNDYTELLEPYVSYLFETVIFLYTASVAVATRQPYIDLSTDSGIVLRRNAASSVVAGQAIKHFISAVYPQATSIPGVLREIGLDRMTPFEGPLKSFTISAIDMDAGDTITEIRIIREEFIHLPGF